MCGFLVATEEVAEGDESEVAGPETEIHSPTRKGFAAGALVGGFFGVSALVSLGVLQLWGWREDVSGRRRWVGWKRRATYTFEFALTVPAWEGGRGR